MTEAGVWVVILAIGAGTYAIRSVFLVLADRLASVPEGLRIALRMIPPAALAALTAPALLRPEGHLDPVSPELGAGVLALLVAWRTRSIPLTLTAGIVAVVALQQLGVG